MDELIARLRDEIRRLRRRLRGTSRNPRMARTGTQNGNSVLSDTDRDAIRALRAQGWTISALAREWDVARTTITGVIGTRGMRRKERG